MAALLKVWSRTLRGEEVESDNRKNRGPGRRKIVEGFMDSALVRTAQALRRKGLFDEIGAPIKEGKEAIILLASFKNELRVIKVHKIETSKFEHMEAYLVGDPRFAHARLHNRRALVYAWARKEFANLKRAHAAGVRCPEPFGVLNNVLVLGFVGNESVAPQIKEIRLDEPAQFFQDLILQYRTLYKTGLVHADFSEYNILVHSGEPWLIDFAQAVVRAHPKAQEFFERDVENIVRYFNRTYALDASVETVKKTIVEG